MKFVYSLCVLLVVICGIHAISMDDFSKDDWNCSCIFSTYNLDMYITPPRTNEVTLLASISLGNCGYFHFYEYENLTYIPPQCSGTTVEIFTPFTRYLQTLTTIQNALQIGKNVFAGISGGDKGYLLGTNGEY